MSAAKENGGKKSAMKKKINFFKLTFSRLKQNFFELFFLVFIANCAKFKMQQEKSWKKNFTWEKDREMVIGYTFRVGYIYRADCSFSVPVSRSLQVLLPASQPTKSSAGGGGSPVETLQSHFILTMSHWSSGLPVFFPSQGTQVQIPRGVLLWNRDSPVSIVSLLYHHYFAKNEKIGVSLN